MKSQIRKIQKEGSKLNQQGSFRKAYRRNRAQRLFHAYLDPKGPNVSKKARPKPPKNIYLKIVTYHLQLTSSSALLEAEISHKDL